MKTHFTRHAWSRIHGRLSLSPSDVAQLLDRNIAVDVGVEPGSNRQHRVFFSEPDRVCFVAIQDMKNGAVVTVLPIHFHDRIAWQVSAEAQEEARALVSHMEDATTQASPRPEVRAGAPALKVTAYRRASNGAVSVLSFGVWPPEPPAAGVGALTQDPSFWAAIEAELAGKCVRIDEVEALYVRFGNKGALERLELRPGMPSAA